MRTLTVVSLILALVPLSVANTPGKHIVALNWKPGACTVAGTCFSRVYRGTSPNVCAGTPTPIADNVIGSTWTDLNPPTGTVYYNVSNVDPAKGGESTCNGEVQPLVPPITTDPDSALAAAVQ